jgi:flagellar biosynthesis GTPase FlhF
MGRRLRIKKISPKDFGRMVAKATSKVIGVNPQEFGKGGAKGFFKTLGKAAYNVSGAKTLVDSGKALAKCKPGDAKCIAGSLAKIASVALMYIPGAGGAAAVAMKVGQTAVKNAVKGAVEAEIKKKLAKQKAAKAQAKLAAATTDEEKAAAQTELQQANTDVATADQQLQKAQANQKAAEKQLNDASIELAKQKNAEEAYNELQKQKAIHPEAVSKVESKFKLAIVESEKTLKYLLGFLVILAIIVFFLI